MFSADGSWLKLFYSVDNAPSAKSCPEISPVFGSDIAFHYLGSFCRVLVTNGVLYYWYNPLIY